MDTHALLRRAARLEYAAVRLPLHVVDQQVVRRYLDRDSAARQSFERALHTFDEVVAGWLWPAQAPNTGDTTDDDTATDETIAAVTVADVTDDGADAESADAGDEGGSGAQLSADEVERIDTLTEEFVEEQQTETFAGELADSDDLRRVQAELEAKRLVEEQDE